MTHHFPFDIGVLGLPFAFHGRPLWTRPGRPEGFVFPLKDSFHQLANVFRGDMSLVGPRAERPEFVKEYIESIPKYMLRHKVKAGLTGWAQISGLRQATSIEKRLEYDFYYIQNWSLALDAKILWKTLRGGFIDRNVK